MNSLKSSLKLRTSLKSRRAIVAALVCELTLVAVYLFDVVTAGHFQFLHALFDLDSEGNIPAWFSSSQLFCVAITFWSCAVRHRRGSKPSKLFFLLAGAAAVYGSSDETAQIHERITALMGQRYIDWLPSYAAHNFLFVMIAVAVLLTVCQFLADDLVSLWKHQRRALLLAIAGLAIALAGGMGVEALGYKLLGGYSESLWYKLEVVVEESMEMIGGTLVLCGALKLRRARGRVFGEVGGKLKKLELAGVDQKVG